jgi:hypothetical protein
VRRFSFVRKAGLKIDAADDAVFLDQLARISI